MSKPAAKPKAELEVYIVLPSIGSWGASTSLKETIQDSSNNLVFSLSEAKSLAKELLEDSDVESAIVYKVDLVPMYEARVELVKLASAKGTTSAEPTDLNSALKDL